MGHEACGRHSTRESFAFEGRFSCHIHWQSSPSRWGRRSPVWACQQQAASSNRSRVQPANCSAGVQHIELQALTQRQHCNDVQHTHTTEGSLHTQRRRTLVKGVPLSSPSDRAAMTGGTPVVIIMARKAE